MHTFCIGKAVLFYNKKPEDHCQQRKLSALLVLRRASRQIACAKFVKMEAAAEESADGNPIASPSTSNKCACMRSSTNRGVIAIEQLKVHDVWLADFAGRKPSTCGCPWPTCLESAWGCLKSGAQRGGTDQVHDP